MNDEQLSDVDSPEEPFQNSGSNHSPPEVSETSSGNGNKTTPVCGPANTICIAKFELQTRVEPLKIKLGRDPDDDTTWRKSIIEKCDCLTMCNNIMYSTNPASFAVSDEDILDWLTYIELIEPGLAQNTDIMTTYIMLYLKESDIETTERNELYGPSDFLSNFGGLLGLFTGFSMLSCIEIIYFLTLRIFANLKLFGHWNGVSQSSSA